MSNIAINGIGRVPWQEQVATDIDSITEVITSPPSQILLNVYATQEDANGNEVPNWEGLFSIWALTMLSQEIFKRNPQHVIDVYIAGAHPTSHGGENMSSIYSRFLGQLELPNVRITDEAKFNNRGAVDTRGEIRFFKESLGDLTEQKPAVISRAPHINRIRTIANAMELPVNTRYISAEGILSYFLSESIDTTLIDEDVRNDYATFSMSEEKKLKLMELLHDESGLVMELIARCLDLLARLSKSDPKEFIQQTLRKK